MRIYCCWDVETENPMIIDIWTRYMQSWSDAMPESIRQQLSITSIKLLACGKGQLWTN